MTIKKQQMLLIALTIFGCYAGYSMYNHHQQIEVYKYNNQILQQDIQRAQQQIDQLQMTYSDMYFKLNSLTVAQFESKVANGERIYAYIGRPDCSDCNMAEPELTTLIEKYHLADHIVYVNVSQLYKDKKAWSTFKERYQIKGTPVLVKFEGGQQVNKVDKEELNHFTKSDIMAWLTKNRLVEGATNEK